MSDLPTIFRHGRLAVERALRTAPLPGVPAVLRRSIRYSLLSGGKRLRPLLVLLSCRALGGRDRDALPAAVALEMVHTYSLIHDDLPAMDNDDFRRGKPTNHKVFGEANAILAGDALLTLAFETLAQDIPDPRVSATLVRELAEAAGPAGMVGGQALDLKTEKPTDLINARKTAALFRASTRMGALCARASGRAIDRLGEYGFHLGLAFQNVDDILDRERGTPAALRKARKSTERALRALAFLGRKGILLQETAEFLLSRTR